MKMKYGVFANSANRSENDSADSDRILKAQMKTTENRTHPRTHVPPGTAIYECETGQPIGDLRNISVEGLMICSEQIIESGTMITARATLPDQRYDVQVHFEALCVWHEIGIARNVFWSGFQITAIESDFLTALSYWIDEN